MCVCDYIVNFSSFFYGERNEHIQPTRLITYYSFVGQIFWCNVGSLTEPGPRCRCLNLRKLYATGTDNIKFKLSSVLSHEYMLCLVMKTNRRVDRKKI